MNIDKLEGSFEVVAVSTSPRTAFREFYDALTLSVFNLRIPHLGYGGAYWAQSMENVTEDAINNHAPKFLLYLDGDSVFDAEDILKLLKIIKENDHIDAICPVQADRNGPWPLTFGWNNSRLGPYDYSGELTNIAHGHHGCTIIRAEAFRKMPKPWFIDVPATDGTYRGKNKRDADTNFWWQFNQAGLNLYQANKIVIGHMDLHVRWQNGSEVIVQTLADWRANGKPNGLRCPTVDEMAEMGVLDPHQLPPKDNGVGTTAQGVVDA